MMGVSSTDFSLPVNVVIILVLRLVLLFFFFSLENKNRTVVLEQNKNMPCVQSWTVSATIPRPSQPYVHIFLIGITGQAFRPTDAILTNLVVPACALSKLLNLNDYRR